MRMPVQALIPLLALATACGGGGSSDTDKPAAVNTPAPVKSSMSDTEILTRVYDNLYSVPEGFFVDERAETDRSYTIHHVLDASRSYELCTDDYATAMAWEEADNASRSVNGYFVESYDNERYFEFVRELSYQNDVGNVEDITSPGFARVFKCSNTERDGVDRTLYSGYAGVINDLPLESDKVREFSEYLWQFTFFPNSRKKVLTSESGAAGDDLHHTLTLAFASSQGSGRCDLIELVDWTFTASRTTGEVTQSFDVTRSFEAKLEGGTPQRCDG